MLKRFPVSFTIAFLALSLFLASPALRSAASNRQSDVMKTSAGELRITPLYHGSVMLEFGGKVIHVDPWSQGDYTGIPQADLIVITHTHADHLDHAMVDKLKKPETLIKRVADRQGHDRRYSLDTGKLERADRGAACLW